MLEGHQMRPEIVADARAWLADLEWEDEPDFTAMSADTIIQGIRRHYDGGLAGFLLDGSY